MAKLEFWSKEAFNNFLSLGEATGCFVVPEDIRPLVVDALYLVTSQIKVSDEELATRWGCSIAPLQKMRRLGNGVPYMRLSPGFIRYSLRDIISYEYTMRIPPVAGVRA